MGTVSVHANKTINMAVSEFELIGSGQLGVGDCFLSRTGINYHLALLFVAAG